MSLPSKRATDRRAATRDMVLYGLMGGVLVAVQVALAPLPNVEMVSLLILAFTSVMGVRALWPVYVFVLLEALIFGFGLWVVNYLCVWAVLVFAALVLRKYRPGRAAWILLATLFGLLFGALCAIPYFFIGGWPMAFSYWVSGIPFDLAHAAGNGLMALALFKPLEKALLRAGLT